MGRKAWKRQKGKKTWWIVGRKIEQLGELGGSRKAKFSKNRKGEKIIIKFDEMELGNMKGGWYEADDVKIGDMWIGWYPFFDEILVPFISTLSRMVHTQPFNANLRCQRWQEGCVGKQKQLVDDRRLLSKRKVEREALLGVISEIAFVNSSKRRLCSLDCENYTVKTILWKLYCENYTVTVTVTILYYTILWRPAETLGESILLYTILYC